MVYIQYVRIPDSDSLDVANGNGISIVVWIKPPKILEGGDGKFYVVLDKQWDDQRAYQIYIRSTGEMWGKVQQEAATRSVNTNWENRWYHVVFTCNKQISKLYIDNVLQDTDNGSVVVGNDIPLVIGANRWMNMG